MARTFLMFLPLVCLLFAFAMTPAPAHAQWVTSAAQPPGTIGTGMQNVVSWVRWIFGIIAVLLIVFGCFALAKHAASGMWELGGALICIIVAASASSIVTFLYGSGSG